MAIQDNSWDVYWDEYASDVYLYGSEIQFHSRNDVEFKNALMPAGTIIKSWYSLVNYQRGRIEPTLPIIDADGSYRISLQVDCDVPQGVFLRLVFFDRIGEEIGNLVVDHDMDFSCPPNAYSYKAELICAGGHSIRFHSFTIAEMGSQ